MVRYGTFIGLTWVVICYFDRGSNFGTTTAAQQTMTAGKDEMNRYLWIRMALPPLLLKGEAGWEANPQVPPPPCS